MWERWQSLDPMSKPPTRLTPYTRIFSSVRQARFFFTLVFTSQPSVNHSWPSF